jgi:hypothetical protein
VSRQSAELAALRGELRALKDELADREEEIETMLTELATSALGEPDDPIRRSQTLQHLRRLLRASVGRRSRVTVASDGDDALVRAAGVNAEHLSRDAVGRYIGHPVSGLAAVGQLEAARWRGADALLIPAASLWWLDHYGALARHLDRHYSRIAYDESVGALWDLHQDSPWRELSDALAWLRVLRGRDPVILDLCGQHGLSRRFEECNVVSPPIDTKALPYLDRTIDVVAVSSDETGVVSEASRVALDLVVRISTSKGSTQVDTLWKADERLAARAAASLVVVPADGELPSANYLELLLDSLPRSFSGEILVDPDVVPNARSAVSRGWRVTAVRTGSRGAYTKRLRRMVGAADRGTVIVVPTSVMPIPGWVAPLAYVLGHTPRAAIAAAGVVGTDGRLSPADPSVCAADGHGYGEAPDSDGRRHIRPVTAVSSGPFAARRELLLHADGTHPLVSTAAEAARGSGLLVYYQPQSLAVTRSFARPPQGTGGGHA